MQQQWRLHPATASIYCHKEGWVCDACARKASRAIEALPHPLPQPIQPATPPPTARERRRTIDSALNHLQKAEVKLQSLSPVDRRIALPIAMNVVKAAGGYLQVRSFVSEFHKNECRSVGRRETGRRS